MTSSLVGSEMCIRDRPGPAAAEGVLGPPAVPAHRRCARFLPGLSSVSYTHLTLPTSVDLGGR
eukprot:10783697-Prorocentrum_lima.AAC.1